MRWIVILNVAAGVAGLAGAAPGGNSLRQRVESLTREERALADQERDLRARGFDVASVHARAAAFVKTLTPAESLMIGHAEEAAWPPEKARALGALRDHLRRADAAQKNFLDALDAYSRAKMAAYVEAMHVATDELLDDKKDFLKTRGKADYRCYLELRQALDRQYDEYQLLRTSPKGNRPGVYNKAVRAYLDTSGRLLGALHDAEQGPARAVAVRLTRWASATHALLDSSISLIEIAPALGKLVAEVKRQPYAPPPGKTPTIKAMDETLKAFAQARDQTVEITGRENLPRPINDKELNLILPVHRDIYVDPVIVAHLDLEAYHVFVAHQRFVPQHALLDWMKLSQRIHDNRDFLPVGEKGGESIDRMFARLEEGGVRNIVIFPEGTTSLAGETGPVPESFVSSFIDRLRARGYRLNIVPLTAELPAGVRQSLGERAGRLALRGAHVKAHLHPAWSPEMLDLYRSLGDRQAVSRLIRAEWLSELTTDERLLFGQLRAQPMAGDLHAFLERRIGPVSSRSCVREHLQGLLGPGPVVRAK